MKILKILIVISGLFLIVYTICFFLEIVVFDDLFYLISLASLVLILVFTFLKKVKIKNDT